MQNSELPKAFIKSIPKAFIVTRARPERQQGFGPRRGWWAERQGHGCRDSLNCSHAWPASHLGVDVKAIQTAPGIFCMENHD
jgi:hypothetical protein